jgi:pyruvate/2-oxoacid:ferredoxin oxidoreductase alpha subunit
MKAHKIEMIAVWAREHGIRGYEHLDPQSVAKRRLEAINEYNKRENEKFAKKQDYSR